MLRIRGGVGGLSFQFEELLAGASALDGLVRRAGGRGGGGGSVRRALFPYQYDSYSTGSNAIVAVGEAARALGRVRMELERLCGEVRASHREYESAEARNTLLLRIGRTGPGYGPLWGLAGLPPLTVRDTAEDEFSLAPGRLALLLGLPAGAAAAGGPAGGVRAAIRGLTDAPGLDFLRPRPVRITGRETRTEEADVSPAGLLLRAGAVGRNSGEIEVLRLGQARKPRLGGDHPRNAAGRTAAAAPTPSTPPASPRASATTRPRPPRRSVRPWRRPAPRRATKWPRSATARAASTP